MFEDHIPAYVRFIIGGVSGVGASMVTHPLDLIKTRMQLSGMGEQNKEFKTSFHALNHVIKKEGFRAIYKGLSATVVRQATFTSTRLGVYTSLIDRLTQDNGKPPSFLQKLVCGAVGGVAGAFVGTPADIALIRMSADGRVPLEERRNYKHVFDALFRMAREEGVLTLWRGTIPTMVRAVVVNMCAAVYFQVKELFLMTGHFDDDLICHVVSSMVSGVFTTLTALPVDITKTRLQDMKRVDGKPEYKGMVDVVAQIVRKEGVTALWKGITPAYMRIGPHTVIFFLAMEQLTSLYRTYGPLGHKPH